MQTSFDIREQFLAYFEEKGHRRVASHSLVPPADPTLLFVNAGMVQFKDIFTGDRKTDFKRAASSQKCLRVSGKHNDLENVGRTARHHTFFEMLGNFSFGDYFKAEAIAFAYELLVKRIGLPADRLYYTVFGGDAAEGLLPDLEAEALWMKTAGVSKERVLHFGKKDNFWAMGETGPCGPCSEILFDRGPGPWACNRPECKPGCDCDRYVEIWNLVFMQFLRSQAGGALQPLPAPSIDTGMGLERLTSILQNKVTNYDTDLFLPYIELTAELLLAENPKANPYGREASGDVAYRVIADHARTAAFLCADKVYPDNEGRGYIARLIMRRAIRFGKMLGFQEPFLHKVCGRVVTVMGTVYPELAAHRDLIDKVVLQEENAFGRTYEDGRGRLERQMESLAAGGCKVVPGDFAFWLYDERGFPPDLTELIASEKGFSLDRKGFDEAMERKRASSAAGIGGAGGVNSAESLKLSVPATTFKGYGQDSLDTTLLAVLSADGQPLERAVAGLELTLILAESPFYAESGGQVGDSGVISGPGFLARVSETRKTRDGVFLHSAKLEQGELRPGVKVKAAVDVKRRGAISRHHTATHLLHQALCAILGEHVKQEGSLVTEDFLRFDFRHFNALAPEELEQVQSWILERVLADWPVETAELPAAEASKTGAKAFFGDKYGDTVRVVSTADGESREFCGGVHVRRTGEIGAVLIQKQEAVSSGIRRIYAVAGEAALRQVMLREAMIRDCSREFHCSPETLYTRIHQLQRSVSDQEKEIETLRAKLLSASSGAAAGDSRTLGGVVVTARRLLDSDMDSARQAADLERGKNADTLVLVAASKDDKLVFVLAAGGSAVKSADCGKLCRELAGEVKARGGGSAAFAQAGGAAAGDWDRLKNLFWSRAEALLEKQGG